MTRLTGRTGRTGGLPSWLRIGLLLAPALLVIGVFFVGGIAQAIAQSLGYQPYLPDSRFSLDAYTGLWADPAVRASLGLTARIAGLTTVVSAVLGVGIALLISGLGRSRRWVTAILQTNLAVPHLVGALCMLLLLSPSGLLSRLAQTVGLSTGPTDFPELTNDRFGWAIIAEYIWKETVFLTVITLAALTRGIPDLENAARSLGAGRWQRLRYVTLPLIMPSVAAGSVLVFAFTAGSYEVPYLLGQPYPATLPVVALQRYSDTDLTSRPGAMAVAVVITVATCLIVLGYLALVSRLSGRSESGRSEPGRSGSGGFG